MSKDTGNLSRGNYPHTGAEFIKHEFRSLWVEDRERGG